MDPVTSYEGVVRTAWTSTCTCIVRGASRAAPTEAGP